MKIRVNNAIRKINFNSILQINLLNESDLKFIYDKSKAIFIKKKAILFRQGSYPHGVYFIKKGMFKVYQENPDGTVQLIFIYTKGEIFGLYSVLSGDNQTVTVEALQDSEVIFLERSAFLDLLTQSNNISNQLLISMSHEFNVLIKRLSLFAHKNSKERMAIVLLILNEKFLDETKSDLISEISISRADLANFIGTTIETLSRTIKSFKKLKIISTKGKIIKIEDFEFLLNLSGL